MLNNDLLKRRLSAQLQDEWDISNIDWTRGVDLDRDLLPLSRDVARFATEKNISHRSLSWLFGLLAASSISEHERVLNDLKDNWEASLRKMGPSRELLDLGYQFFKEEMKHSEAFRKYLEIAAIFLNLKFDELKSFLPTYSKDSLSAGFYRADLKWGGNSLWWTVAITEEESIELFKMLNKNAGVTDPLFYQINKLHYQEEIRHSSFSYLMIDLYASKKSTYRNQMSYLLARNLQNLWMLNQLRRLRGVHQFADRHPYLKDISGFVKAIDELSLFKKLQLIFKDDSYVTMMMRPEGHLRIRKQLGKMGLKLKPGECL